MAGTFAEQAALATSNDFINKVRVALVKRAVELDGGTDRLEVPMLNLVRQILNDGCSGYSTVMAWNVAAGNATIAAAAPAVPNDNDTQYEFGGEYAWSHLLFLRGGYKVGFDEQG